MNKLLANFTIDKYGLQVRLVNIEDANFIVNLRTNPLLSKYLHTTSSDVNIQTKWIQDYKVRESKGLDYYFVFSKNGIRIGVERIYNITNDDFTHGSLIFSTDAPLGSSIIADIITREIGFNLLDLPVNLFDVRKGNNNVINYHKSYGSELIDEDYESFYYKLTNINFEKNKIRYLKMFTR